MEQRLAAQEIASAVQPGSEESWVDKARREVQLIATGVGGFTDAASEAFIEHPIETAGNVALGIGIGVGMAYLSRGRGLGLTATKTIGAVSGLAFLKDIAANGSEVAGAMRDTWKSGHDRDKNSQTMRVHLGKFAFDTVLLSAAGAAGSKLGHGMFNVKLSDLPKKLVPQMNEKGISQDYYNKLIMADHYANVATNSLGKYSPEKVARAQQSLQESLNGMVTYRNYWTNEMATYRAGGATLDTKAAMNVLIDGNRDAKALNRLSQRLKTFGSGDVTAPQVLSGISSHLQQARQIIYGTRPAG